MTSIAMTRGIVRTSTSLALLAVIACSQGASNSGDAPSVDNPGTGCVELPVPVTTQGVDLSQAVSCRLSAVALIALLSDSNATSVLAGKSTSPSEFVVRRAPYLPVGSTSSATEQYLVTIRLPRAPWDADVWFTDSLTPLAVSLVHKPM